MSDDETEPGSNGRDDLLESDDQDRIASADYDTMLVLERLESLEEEMADLGVSTLDEVHQRIADINRQLDAEQ
jgi:uncharacterized protein related to proFAR isomerase